MLTPIDSKKLAQAPQDKLPSKDERKKDKETREELNGYITEMKTKLELFLVEQILPSQMPIDIVEEIPDLLKSLISIYKGKSVEWKEYLKAKRKMSELRFCDLTDDTDVK